MISVRYALSDAYTNKLIRLPQKSMCTLKYGAYNTEKKKDSNTIMAKIDFTVLPFFGLLYMSNVRQWVKLPTFSQNFLRFDVKYS